jgi:hypothetical protein
MKVNFLLGSGISMPAKLPSVSDITQRVLEGRPNQKIDAIQNPLGFQIETEKREMACRRQTPILRLLERLKVSVHRRLELAESREANYEDLAYLCSQMVDDLSDNRANPALLPFLDQLIADLNEVLRGVNCENDASNYDRLYNLADQTFDYIHDVAAVMLRKKPWRKAYLSFFADAIRDDHSAEVNLFTLNHDRLLETYLRGMRPTIRLIDGFGEKVDGLRRWNPMLFDAALGEKDRPAVRLFKLHGSIDWFWRRPRSNRNDRRNPWADEFVGVRPPRIRNAGRRQETEAPGRSLFLAGTMNKEVTYTVTPFLDLHYRFHRILGESEHLIVIGYSFGDKGVNQRLSEWMGASRTRRMLVIDPKSLDELRRPAGSSIKGQIENWGKQRFDHWQVRFGATDCTWSAAKERLFVSGQQTD